jgi:hypothetical protein
LARSPWRRSRWPIQDAAAASLAAIPDLAESSRDRRAVARWLRHLYPVEGDSWPPGLCRTILGDALVRPSW